jgi:hypothetical protein
MPGDASNSNLVPDSRGNLSLHDRYSQRFASTVAGTAYQADIPPLLAQGTMGYIPCFTTRQVCRTRLLMQVGSTADRVPYRCFTTLA